MSWLNHLIHIIDFEGNLDSGIVEYGIASIQGGELISAKTQICRAAQPISEADVAIHGIRTEDTLDTTPFKDTWGLFTSLRQAGALAAHYAPYENMLLRAVWPYTQVCPNYLEEGSDSCEWGPWVDSCELYRVLFPGLKSYKLNVLVGTFELQTELDAFAQKYCPPNRCKYHCALYDALASALLLLHLKEFEAVAKQDIKWLLLSSMVSEKKRQAHQQLSLF